MVGVNSPVEGARERSHQDKHVLLLSQHEKEENVVFQAENVVFQAENVVFQAENVVIESL